MAHPTSVTGADVTVVGTLASSGDVTLQGSVRGGIQATGCVTISEQGKLVGDLEAKHAMIRGRIEGNVRADKVRLFASCNVKGDMSTGGLRLKMALDSKAIAGPPKSQALMLLRNEPAISYRKVTLSVAVPP
jgi:cytoskeletal protein CcmA (bactofilin family)